MAQEIEGRGLYGGIQGDSRGGELLSVQGCFGSEEGEFEGAIDIGGKFLEVECEFFCLEGRWDTGV